MKKSLLFFISLGTMFFVSAQSNLIFSIPRDYAVKVSIQNYDYTKPQTWQVKFENVPEGKYDAVITLSKSDNSFQKTQTFSLEVKTGYEITYFAYPANSGLECKLAIYYPLDQIYNKKGNTTTEAPRRLDTYEGKPVLNQKDFRDFWDAATKITYGPSLLEFLQKQVPKFYFYTDDIVYLANIFTYEPYKLDFAKFAYDYTIDKHLYFKLRKSFSYGPYYDELEKYIAAKEK
jgi:hypothetical protein